MAVQMNDRVEDLLKAGRKALKARNPDLASEHFRKAAELSPYDERVWVALLEVLAEDEDRRVCLENIARINPLNPKVAQQQRELNPPDPQAEAEERFARHERRVRGRQRRWRAFRGGVGLGLLAGFTGVLIGVVTSIFLYGFGLNSSGMDIWFTPLRTLFAR